MALLKGLLKTVLMPCVPGLDAFQHKSLCPGPLGLQYVFWGTVCAGRRHPHCMPLPGETRLRLCVPLSAVGASSGRRL